MANTIFIQFFSWYFLTFPLKILENGKDFMIWCWRFFSIGFFLPRIFSPWHKDITSYGRGFDLVIWFHAAAWNLISRFVGAILRLFFIIIGLGLEVVVIASTVVCFAAWFGLLGLIIYLLASVV